MPINDSMQANTQHAVPQNIMAVEFKLIGELTMRQFFYLMIFAGIAYAAYSFKIPLILRWPTIIGSILLGLGFAFVPIEDRGFDEWIINFFRAVYSENQKVWKKEILLPTAFLYENISRVKQELITLAPTSSRRKLEQYLHHQEEKRVVDPLDIPEQAYIEKVRAAFVSTPVQTSVVLEEPMVETPIPTMPMGPTHDEKPEPEKKTGAKEEKKPTKIAEGKKIPEKVAKEGDQQKKGRLGSKIIKQARKIHFPTSRISTPLIPITPDRHSGRKFTNLLAGGGNIVLPIRGEKVLEASPHDEQLEEDTQNRAQQLRMYLNQLKQQEGIQVETPQTAPVQETQIAGEAAELLKKLQSENERLMTEIEKLKAKVEGTDQTSLKELMERQEKKEATLRELEEKVRTLKPDEPSGIPAGNVKTREIPGTKIPNIITGIVRGPQNRVLPGILLIIKNSQNDPIRAIKSNALGQFTISNPLPNGTYTINVDVNKETGFTFDIIDVEAKGDIISPMEFAGKV